MKSQVLTWASNAAEVVRPLVWMVYFAALLPAWLGLFQLFFPPDGIVMDVMLQLRSESVAPDWIWDAIVMVVIAGWLASLIATLIASATWLTNRTLGWFQFGSAAGSCDCGGSGVASEQSQPDTSINAGPSERNPIAP